MQIIIKTCAWLCAVWAAVALSGCGGGSGSTTATPAVVTSVVTTVTTPAGVSDFTTIDFNAVTNYSKPTLPAYYDATVTALDNAPNTPAASDKIATLGRVLFYDPRLSINNTKSCASCHQQAIGFTDTAQFSTGFSGMAFTTAHAMRLGNVRYYAPGTMFWNKRTATVEAQASQPIINSVELGFDTAAGGFPPS